MAKESWLDSNHIRVTSDDGRTSYLYEIDVRGQRTCTEVARRKADGTTDDYVPSRVLDDLFWGSRDRNK